MEQQSSRRQDLLLKYYKRSEEKNLIISYDCYQYSVEGDQPFCYRDKTFFLAKNKQNVMNVMSVKLSNKKINIFFLNAVYKIIFYNTIKQIISLLFIFMFIFHYYFNMSWVSHDVMSVTLYHEFHRIHIYSF